MPLPHTEAPGHLIAELAARGIRITRQRRTILNIMETANRHLDASQILRKAQRQDAAIDRVTVYRTLGLLKRHGLEAADLTHEPIFITSNDGVKIVKSEDGRGGGRVTLTPSVAETR